MRADGYISSLNQQKRRSGPLTLLKNARDKRTRRGRLGKSGLFLKVSAEVEEAGQVEQAGEDERVGRQLM
jgi:hypothetical protein